MSNKKITIAICTYNRAELLKLALESLEQQDAAADLFEVLLVDNNSTDTTPQIFEESAKRLGTARYVLEKNQGLSHARNRAYLEADSEYIAYLDDDAIAPADYVSKALSIIASHHPDAFGGPIYPYYLTAKPAWFKDEFEIRIHCKETGFFGEEGGLSGSNMIFTRSMLVELGGFNPDLGMKGGVMMYGEENDLLNRARKAGKTMYYDHALHVRHYVPEYKMNLLYFAHKFNESGHTSYRIRRDEGLVAKQSKDELLASYQAIVGEISRRINAGNELARKGESNPDEELFGVLKKLYTLAGVYEAVEAADDRDNLLRRIKRKLKTLVK